MDEIASLNNIRREYVRIICAYRVCVCAHISPLYYFTIVYHVTVVFEFVLYTYTVVVFYLVVSGCAK